MNGEEFRSLKLLKLKYGTGDKIIQTFCKFASTKKLDPPSLVCRNYKTLRKVFLNHAECIDLLNDAEFWSLKRLKLKYRSGDKIIKTFCKFASPQKLCPPSLVSRNFKILRKVILDNPELIEI